MMKAQLTFREVLGKAIQKEIESRLLYTDLHQKMKNPIAKDTFQELAQQEQGHQNFLEQYQRGKLKGRTLRQDEKIDYKIAEYFDQPKISPDMKLEDVFLLAANREKASHQLYLDLAQIHPLGKVKKLFKWLAEQELSHKHRVEFLYTEVAFPQTNGG